MTVEIEGEALVFQGGPEFEGGEAAFVGWIVGCEEVVEAVRVEGAGGGEGGAAAAVFVVGDVVQVDSPDRVWEDGGHGAVLLSGRSGISVK